jgi:hypothetical protein
MRFKEVFQKLQYADNNVAEKSFRVMKILETEGKKNTRQDHSDISSRFINVMACQSAVPPSLLRSHISKRSSKSNNKRQTLLLETERKRNKSSGNEDWRKEDKKV